jgi:lysophospholipase L1-like esterase
MLTFKTVSLHFVKSKVFDKTVDKVVISLGTNDITKSKDDHDQVNINLTHAIHQVKYNFPNSVVGICTILPRKGKGPNITKCNDTVLNVNIFLKKLCIREQIECVDAYELFTKQGNVLKSLFDNTDSSREITFYLVYCMCKININLVMITFRLCNVVCT